MIASPLLVGGSKSKYSAHINLSLVMSGVWKLKIDKPEIITPVADSGDSLAPVTFWCNHIRIWMKAVRFMLISTVKHMLIWLSSAIKLMNITILTSPETGHIPNLVSFHQVLMENKCTTWVILPRQPDINNLCSTYSIYF